MSESKNIKVIAVMQSTKRKVQFQQDLPKDKSILTDGFTIGDAFIKFFHELSKIYKDETFYIHVESSGPNESDEFYCAMCQNGAEIQVLKRRLPYSLVTETPKPEWYFEPYKGVIIIDLMINSYNDRKGKLLLGGFTDDEFGPVAKKFYTTAIRCTYMELPNGYCLDHGQHRLVSELSDDIQRDVFGIVHEISPATSLLFEWDDEEKRIKMHPELVAIYCDNINLALDGYAKGDYALWVDSSDKVHFYANWQEDNYFSIESRIYTALQDVGVETILDSTGATKASVNRVFDEAMRIFKQGALTFANDESMVWKEYDTEKTYRVANNGGIIIREQFSVENVFPLGVSIHGEVNGKRINLMKSNGGIVSKRHVQGCTEAIITIGGLITYKKPIK
jgi:hypothetical protein